MVKKTKTTKMKLVQIAPSIAAEIRTRQNEINLRVDAVRAMLSVLKRQLLVPEDWEYVMRDGVFRPPASAPPDVPPATHDNGTPAPRT